MTDEMNEEKAIHEALKKIVQGIKDGDSAIKIVKMDMSEDILNEIRQTKEDLEILEQKMPKTELQFMTWADDFIEDTFDKLAKSGIDNLRCIGMLEQIKFKILCPNHTKKIFSPKKAGNNDKPEPKRKATKKKLVSKQA